MTKICELPVVKLLFCSKDCVDTNFNAQIAWYMPILIEHERALLISAAMKQHRSPSRSHKQFWQRRRCLPLPAVSTPASSSSLHLKSLQWALTTAPRTIHPAENVERPLLTPFLTFRKVHVNLATPSWACILRIFQCVHPFKNHALMALSQTQVKIH